MYLEKFQFDKNGICQHMMPKQYIKNKQVYNLKYKLLKIILGGILIVIYV